jgi:hypothetical protein
MGCEFLHWRFRAGDQQRFMMSDNTFDSRVTAARGNGRPLGLSQENAVELPWLSALTKPHVVQ